MPEQSGKTTQILQSYVVQLAQNPDTLPQNQIVREMIGRAAGRLEILCKTVLYQRYPRLTRAPLNLQADELLSSVVERLLKAMQKAKPNGVREFFALANQHMLWELNDLARRLDNQEPNLSVTNTPVFAPVSSGSELSHSARTMLQAIENLPDDEREVFSLVRIQGLPQVEAAEILGVSPKTIQRRLNRSLIKLTQALSVNTIDLDSQEQNQDAGSTASPGN